MLCINKLRVMKRNFIEALHRLEWRGGSWNDAEAMKKWWISMSYVWCNGEMTRLAKENCIEWWTRSSRTTKGFSNSFSKERT